MTSTVMFLLYLFALVFMVLGGFFGLIESQGNPAFLLPILFGLYFFWILWEITVGRPEKSAAGRDNRRP